MFFRKKDPISIAGRRTILTNHMDEWNLLVVRVLAVVGVRGGRWNVMRNEWKIRLAHECSTHIHESSVVLSAKE